MKTSSFSLFFFLCFAGHLKGREKSFILKFVFQERD